MEAKIYDKTGKEAGTVSLPEKVFGAKWNPDLVHQVVVGMQANARTPVAHTKDRSEVRGGGAKPWRQKGTGRARHGSRRSPIWAGGGVAFGPRNEKDYAKKINKKMRTKALYSVLSRKLADGEIIFVKDLAMTEPKTKDAVAVLQSLGQVEGFAAMPDKERNAACVTISDNNAAIAKSFRNLPNVLVRETRNLNPVTALTYKYLVITDPENAIATLEQRST